MALLKVLLFPDPRLRTVAEPVAQFDESLKRITNDMLETMYEGSGIGLAATQVNVHKRIIVIDISEHKDNPLILINPKLKKIVDPQKKSYPEGCLSVPGFYENISRPKNIKVSTLNYNNELIEIEASGLLSTCIQHEIDHLNGKLFVDHISSLKRNRIEKKIVKLKKEGTLSSRENTPNYKSAT